MKKTLVEPKPSALIERNTERSERIRPVALLCLGLLAAAPAAADAARLFRYRDAHGVMHIDTNLPPGQAQNGYEVLDQRTLKVLNVVDSAPTPQQLQARAAHRREEALAQEAAAKAEADKVAARTEQVLRDRMLLQTYADETELARLRDAKLENLDLILRAAENTIGHLRQNLLRADRLLADHKAAGRGAPAAVVKMREQTAADLASQEHAADRTRAEQAELRARFDADLDRYRRLTGTPVKTARN